MVPQMMRSYAWEMVNNLFKVSVSLMGRTMSAQTLPKS